MISSSSTVPVARRTAVVLLAALLGLGFLVVGASPASAATPPWEPDPSSVGTIAFYNSAGTVVKSGSSTASPFATYAVGSAAPQADGTQAELEGCLPVAGQVTGNWSCDYLSSLSHYPVTTGPSVITKLTSAHPVATVTSSDNQLAVLAVEFPNGPAQTTDPNYEYHYQIRLLTTDAAGVSTVYDTADITISGGKWKQVWPVVPSTPTNVSGASRGSGAQVSWTAPANGGAAILGYDIRYSSNGGTTWTSASTSFHTKTATTELVTGLTNGTSYIFDVAAINIEGKSPYSAASSAVVPALETSALTGGTSKTITHGTSTTVSSKLTDTVTAKAIAGASVKLLSRPGTSGTFTLLTTLTTNTTGLASTTLSPAATTQYEFQYAGDSVHAPVTSAVDTVTVH
jgi:hypothetical protein